MQTDIERVIRRTTYVSAVLGVVLSPIPLADEIVLLPTYGVLAVKIGQAHGIPFGAMPWRPIALTALAGLGARAAVNITVSYIPFVAAAANAASAVALTTFFGRYVDGVCRDPKEARALSMKDILESIRPPKKPAQA
jgi:uncharacterized protein (DUF697 family)